MINRFPLVLPFLLLTSVVDAQTVTIREAGETFVLHWGNQERLTGGTGVIQHQSEPFAVQKTVRDDVVLLTLLNRKTEITSQTFAGVFFHNIPQPQHGVTNKYNAPATIVGEKWEGKQVEVGLYEAGAFNAYAAKAPRKVSIKGG